MTKLLTLLLVASFCLSSQAIGAPTQKSTATILQETLSLIERACPRDRNRFFHLALSQAKTRINRRKDPLRDPYLMTLFSIGAQPVLIQKDTNGLLSEYVLIKESFSAIQISDSEEAGSEIKSRPILTKGQSYFALMRPSSFPNELIKNSGLLVRGKRRIEAKNDVKRLYELVETTSLFAIDSTLPSGLRFESDATSVLSPSLAEDFAQLCRAVKSGTTMTQALLTEKLQDSTLKLFSKNYTPHEETKIQSASLETTLNPYSKDCVGIGRSPTQECDCAVDIPQVSVQ